MARVKQLSYSRVRFFLKGDSQQARADYLHYCLDDRQTTEACLLGQAIHCELQHLNFDSKVFTAESLGFPDFRSKDARTARDEHIANGETQVSNNFFARVKEVVDEARANTAITEILDGWLTPELHVFGEIGAFSFHGYIDILTESKTLVDIKTVAQFENSLRYCEDYAHQLAIYAELCGGIEPENCAVILVETVAPFRSAVVTFGGCNFSEKIAQVEKAAAIASSIKVSKNELEKVEAIVKKEKEERLDKMKKELTKPINWQEVGWTL